MAIYVVSERCNNNHVAWGTSYEFEDIIVQTCSAQLVAPPRVRFRNRLDLLLQSFTSNLYLRPKDFQFANEPNILLLIGMGPRTMKMLDKLGPWRKKCDIVAAYIVDFYPLSLRHLNRNIINIVSKLDHLFLSYGQMIQPARDRFGIPVTFIPQACDVLTHGTYGGNRPIDIIGYGRQFPEIHEHLKTAFNMPQSNTLYFHSTFKYLDIKNWKEDRLLFWQIMRKSKLSLAYCFQETSPQLAFGVSPITARWFEGIAAGCVVVGYRPKGPEVDNLLNWPDATIELPKNPRDCVPFIQELLEQENYLNEISRRNYLEALKHHDWRYRLKDILNTMGVPIPRNLQDQLNALQVKMAEIE